MTIEQLIHGHSQTSGQKTALVSGDTEISYAGLWEEILKKASWFSAFAQRGDRVILSANKSIEFVYAYFGAHLAGLICVPIDPETNPTRLARIIDVSRPKFVAGELRNSGETKVLPFGEIRQEVSSSFDFPQENDIADLLFTTGTTGLPKGVALTFKNQMAAADNINTFIRNTAEDIELLALGRLRCVLGKGGTLVMLGSFASMKKFFGEMERCRVTGFGMVPASWSYILKMSGDKIARFASQLRYIEIGSAFMSLENKQKLILLVRTFFDLLHGYHVQYNVVSRETMLDAQIHPEDHRDLIVRVAGYSAFFNVLSRQTQDDIIARTEQTL